MPEKTTDQKLVEELEKINTNIIELSIQLGKIAHWLPSLSSNIEALQNKLKN